MRHVLAQSWAMESSGIEVLLCSGMSSKSGRGVAVADEPEIDRVIGLLRFALGAQLTAYLASIRDTRTIRAWTHGTSAPSEEVAERLRLAYRVATILLEWDSQGTVQAWFQGMNPDLNDVSPAQLIREGDLDTAETAILDAVAAFIAHG